MDAGVAWLSAEMAASQLLDGRKPDGQRLLWRRGRSAADSGSEVAGLAVYLLIYSLLGALLALVLRDRLRPTRALLVGIVFALAWYFLSFRLLYVRILPLVALLHVERQTILGHLIYGTFLGRYPVYLPKPPAAGPEQQPEPAPEAPAETPES